MVYLDMTDPTTSCPSGWQNNGYSKRSCGRASSGGLTCDSAFFPVSGGPYTRVCGKIRGYQQRLTDAFEAYNKGRVTTIMLVVSVSHMAVHENTSGHLHLVIARTIQHAMMPVLVMPLSLLPSHHLWV